MRFRLRTLLLIWLVMAPTWLTLIVKAATDSNPSPAYPDGRGLELAWCGLLLIGLTGMVAYSTVNAIRAAQRQNRPLLHYKLRTLLIAATVIPPIAALVWYLYKAGILPPNLESLQVAIPIAAGTGIVISWLDELAEFVSK